MKSLGKQKLGFHGVIQELNFNDEALQYHLMTLGFVEGSTVKIIHEALFGDPIAVRINNSSTVALRRQEASCIYVE